jgi:hypothetical protein
VLLVFLAIGAFALYWIIRKAVSGGMRDYEQRKSVR